MHGSVDEGITALKKEDYRLALEAFSKAANKGDAEALYYLGRMHESGAGIKTDRKKAVELYEKAGENNSTQALKRLAVLYLQGGGAVVQNYKKAEERLKKAVLLGDAEAEYTYGNMLLEGRFVPKDNEQGFATLLSAAKKEFSPAQLATGKLYLEGIGTKPDRKNAHHWFYKAAINGNPQGMYETAVDFETGRGVEKLPGNAHLFYNLAAANGIEQAQAKLMELSSSLGYEQTIEAQAKAEKMLNEIYERLSKPINR